MDVRMARPTDAPLALALSLDDSAHLVKSAGAAGGERLSHTLLRTVLPLAMPGRAWVARDGCNAGLLEARPRRYVIGWDISRLAVRGDATYLLAPLVGMATTHVQSRGVPRLFARSREEASSALAEVGFHPLAREYVLLGPDGARGGDSSLPVDSRYRMPQDAWPIHQLESALTPPLVRQLEGLTSLEWSHKIRGMSEIVIEQDGRVVSWIGWGVRVSHNADQIGMLVHPEHADVAPNLLHHVLQTAPPGRRFVARVRDYHSDVLAVFLDAGFRITAEEILMVKHARVEVAREKARLKVASVPTVPVLHHRLGSTAGPPQIPSHT